MDAVRKEVIARRVTNLSVLRNPFGLTVLHNNNNNNCCDLIPSNRFLLFLLCRDILIILLGLDLEIIILLSYGNAYSRPVLYLLFIVKDRFAMRTISSTNMSLPF